MSSAEFCLAALISMRTGNSQVCQISFTQPHLRCCGQVLAKEALPPLSSCFIKHVCSFCMLVLLCCALVVSSNVLDMPLPSPCPINTPLSNCLCSELLTVTLTPSLAPTSLSSTAHLGALPVPRTMLHLDLAFPSILNRFFLPRLLLSSVQTVQTHQIHVPTCAQLCALSVMSLEA
jgi:hypothetical protein